MDVDRLIATHGARANAFQVAQLLRDAKQQGKNEAKKNNNDAQLTASNNQKTSTGKDGHAPRPSETGLANDGCESDKQDSCVSTAGDSSPEREDERSNARADSNGASSGHQSKEAMQASVGGSDTNVSAMAGESSDNSTADDDGEQLAHQTMAHNHTDSTSAPSGDTPSPTDQCAVEQHDDANESKGDGSSGQKDTSRITRPITSFGGDTAPAWEYVFRSAKKSQGEARKVENALRRLITKVDMGGIDESPRIDTKCLVRELVSKRYALARAVRREQDVPLIVLACDVSGSCSATSAETLVAAVAIANSMANVVVVRHSNGHVIDAIGQVVDGSTQDGDMPKLSQFIMSLKRSIACVVAWGDWDAGDDLQALCEGGADLFWLDSYCATHGPRVASQRLRTGAQTWSIQPRGWWQGVGGAKSTVVALSAMAKGGA